jgi:hypothetical protein
MSAELASPLPEGLARPAKAASEHAAYARFTRLVRYPEGLRVFFLRSSLLKNCLRVLDARGDNRSEYRIGIGSVIVPRRHTWTSSASPSC